MYLCSSTPGGFGKISRGTGGQTSLQSVGRDSALEGGTATQQGWGGSASQQGVGRDSTSDSGATSQQGWGARCRGWGSASQQGAGRGAAWGGGAVTPSASWGPPPGVPSVVHQSVWGQRVVSVSLPPHPVAAVEPATSSPVKPIEPDESPTLPSKQECVSLSQREMIPADKVKDGGELFNNWVLQFSKMLSDGDKYPADCTIEVGDEKIRAHRNILSLNSSVFHDQLVNDKGQGEGKDGCVIQIVGFSVASVKAMVHYFYHGSVDSKELGECGIDLFRIADKYKLDSLKSFVAHHLSSVVDVKNVLSLLVNADSSITLKKACARVVFANRAAVLTSDQWKKMETSHCKLLLDLLKSIVLENEK